ncbi:MAG: TetR/AcrR family transcriptional regulator [Oscillospiraceae bacterium]|nr:TetR/AcrR family transcriptional regulator [Oscillospiraceae bacterium]MDD3832906.1 TetR/AcrR family transcriptional regulator [Oscillospiraceae bacterium]
MNYNGKNRKLKAEATKEKIYKSAVKLFSQNDYNQVTVDAIVKAAGVAKGSFYVHFASKDALITTIINDHVSVADTDYQAFLDTFNEDASAETILISLIGSISDELIDKIGCGKMKAVYKAQITKDVDTGAVMGYNRALYKMLSEVLDRGMQKGEFKSGLSHDIIARHFMLAIRGLTYEWCIRYPEFDLKTQALEHFEILINGLKG